MSGRGLAWPEVREVLDEFAIRWEVGPYGYTVRGLPAAHGFRDESQDWRIRCGSGIAGRGGLWTIVRVQSGHALSAVISNKTELRRAVREVLAGPIPDPTHPERYYATKHHTRFQSGHYIWKIKRWKENGDG